MLKDTALACAVLKSSGGKSLGDADWLSGQPEGPDRGVTTGQGTKLQDPGSAPVSALTAEYCRSLRLS